VHVVAAQFGVVEVDVAGVLHGRGASEPSRRTPRSASAATVSDGSCRRRASSSTAEPVECRGLPGNLGRSAARNGHDHWAEPQLLGAGRDGRERCPRVSHLPHWRPPAQVIPYEDPCQPASSVWQPGAPPPRGRRVRRTTATRAPSGQRACVAYAGLHAHRSRVST
jgi:hypothetical protein